MRIVRFFDTADGGSRFEEVEIAFPQPHTDEFGNTYQLTKAFGPESALFAELPQGLDQDWHVAPSRQLVFVTSGLLEVETTDGQRRRWSTGGLFMADDPRGQGHRTRVIEGPARLLFLRVPEDFRLAEWSGGTGA
jgi:hypothetical protein